MHKEDVSTDRRFFLPAGASMTVKPMGDSVQVPALDSAEALDKGHAKG